MKVDLPLNQEPKQTKQMQLYLYIQPSLNLLWRQEDTLLVDLKNLILINIFLVFLISIYLVLF